MHSSGRSRRARGVAFALCAALLVALPPASRAQTSDAADLYEEALAREAPLRAELAAHAPGESPGPLLRRIRILAGAFEDLARLFPDSDYGDRSLWQGASLAADAFTRFGETADRALSIRLMRGLIARFPDSPLLPQATAGIARLQLQTPQDDPAVVTAVAEVPPSPARAEPPRAVPAAATPAPPPPAVQAAAAPLSPQSAAAGSLATAVAPELRPPAAPPRATPPRATPPAVPAVTPPVRSAPAPTGPVTITAIRRETTGGALRITIELDREVWFYHERLANPPRMFVDLQNTRTTDALRDAAIPVSSDLVRQIRVGRHAGLRTRVVFDLAGATPYSIYALYNPFRVVIDFGRASAGPRSAPAPAVAAAAPAAAVPPPAAAAANANGTFSLARQLGLHVARIAIDPGHGGHDPGARANGLTESDLVLDVALRLEKLLRKEQNVEVVLTRRTDAFVALEERTAIANDSGADLFLSIHANASDATSARGVETYFLNFAPDKDAEAIAARENAGSARSMRELPDLVEAITLNNKIDESRDFATIVQSTLHDRLRRANRSLKNLGVKQAPFMVLIGATMPSVLAEVSFMSNRAEATLLKTERYREQIAEALLAGIMRYQSSLKKTPAVAAAR